MVEIWRDIKDYEGLYQVSNLGRVKSLERIIKRKLKGNLIIKECILIPSKDGGGYLHINLYKNKKYKTCLIHRLVAQAFIPNPENLPEVDHINTIRDDNRLENLHWVDRKGQMANPITKNTRHLVRKGKYYGKYGTENTLSKPIIQYDLDGNFIKEWNYIKQVVNELKILPSSISNCLKNRSKSAGGYIWRYKV